MSGGKRVMARLAAQEEIHGDSQAALKLMCVQSDPSDQMGGSSGA